jgi:pentose-5-phosphate-3-epimerase
VKAIEREHSCSETYRSLRILWSADLLALGDAVQRGDPFVAGYHLDVTDGVCVPDLLFGLDFVHALRRRTQRALDVHLMLSDTSAWVERYRDPGGDPLTAASLQVDAVDRLLVMGTPIGIKGLGLDPDTAPVPRFAASPPKRMPRADTKPASSRQSPNSFDL